MRSMLPGSAIPAGWGAAVFGPAGGTVPDSPMVASRGVLLGLPGARSAESVALSVDWALDADPDYQRVSDGWRLGLPRPDVDRFEYQLAINGHGRDSYWPDPTNPRRVANPFGEKSEIVFPEYRPPAWLGTAESGRRGAVHTPAGILPMPVPVTLWRPDGLDDATPAPLLLAHDGSDLAERGSLLAWATAANVHRPFRVALLDPPHGLRSTWYAANTDYAEHLARVVIPTLTRLVPTTAVVGLGASLGGLAMLTLQRHHPGVLAALASQSGSFFTSRLDGQEVGWPFFRQVCDAVKSFTGAGPGAVPSRAVPVLITHGSVEENRSNNEAMAASLVQQGYQVRTVRIRDAHTMTCWRDAWHPALDQLMDAVSGRGGW